MNQSLKEILIFASGLGIGASAMYFSLKKHFEDKANNEILQASEVYNKKVYELESHKSSVDGGLSGPSEIDVKEKVKELNNKPDILTDYTKYFKGSGEKLSGVTETLRDAKEEADKTGLTEEELAEREGPSDDEPYDSERDYEETLAYEDHMLNGDHRQAVDGMRKPFEIEPSDYELTCANYDKIGLNYYVYDDVLANEGEEMVDEDLFAGDVLENSGFKTDDSDVIFVRNDRLTSDFEIKKMFSKFSQDE